MHRPPVVVVLGHVDHGKTTLLDYIRKSNLASKEAGSITQSIGGYEAHVPIKGYDVDKITFIDTPGHEAFTQLRMRGANVADIAILIVDATASVKPQTIESISHIKQANLPVIVAINKIDMPTAHVDKVKRELAAQQIQVEGLGGTVPFVPISAKEGRGINDLLEGILLLASEKELTYEASAAPEVYVIEARQDKAGPSASCIIKNGTLKVGDTLYCGEKEVKIRALINDLGQQVREVIPSMPFVLLGFKDIPEVGVTLTTQPVKAAEKPQVKVVEDDFANFFAEEEADKLKVIVRADTQGSLDAILPALEKNSHLEVILNSIGDVSKSDIFLAKVSKVVVVSFNARISKEVEKKARQEKVLLRSYSIIYNLIDELQEVSDLMREREEKDKSFKGEAKVQAIFTIEGNVIAGVKVLKGRFDVNDRIEVIRGKRSVGETLLVSVKQRAKVAKEVKKGEEGGLLFEPQLDIQSGDVVKSYSI
jgi:translation initiation factor IF-2